VAAVAAQLNRIVTDALIKADVPVLALQPSASARCHDGTLVNLETHPIRRALERGLVPLVYGDVALDDVRGGTIISTEEIFSYLAGLLEPDRILLVGKARGVYERDGTVIPHISSKNIAEVSESLGGSHSVDVTGGMLSKVQQMFELTRKSPGLSVHILSGAKADLVTRALLEPSLSVGTRISLSLGNGTQMDADEH